MRVYIDACIYRCVYIYMHLLYIYMRVCFMCVCMYMYVYDVYVKHALVISFCC